MTSGSFHSSGPATSNPLVFLPSMRYGSFKVDASYQPRSVQARFTTAPASAIEPGTRYTSAPYEAVSRTIVCGVVSGITTTTRSPARAPYAAQAAPALPAVGSAIVLTPSSSARVTPTAAPRALNVP